jgi:CheY-like chemotaxis protein
MSARVTYSASDNVITIVVSDAGIGINPEILSSPGPKGGIGLLSLRERASYIGGSLTVEGSPGQGSRCTLTVPLSLLEANRHELSCVGGQPYGQPLAPALPSAQGVRVVFADDHHVMRNGLIELMGCYSDIHVVGQASNGREAVEKVRELKPDVVVMDVSMPDMDGIEATRLIKAELPEVRVIGLSMHEDEQIAKLMRQAGAESFITKTAPTDALLKAIRPNGEGNIHGLKF